MKMFRAYRNPQVYAIKDYIKHSLVKSIIISLVCCLILGIIIGASIHSTYYDYTSDRSGKVYYDDDLYDDFHEYMAPLRDFSPVDIAFKMAFSLFLFLLVLETSIILIIAHFKTKFEIMESLYPTGENISPANLQATASAPYVYAPHAPSSHLCPRCGKEVGDDVFCGNCGLPLSSNDPTTEQH